ncbi:MAG: hypothetical protein KME11_21115 [Timaviella obliquedivisa GSE-PSE-MK23-08B]|jgi:predicted glycosyltransferase|nr:hypothetical protein [Timaviella obliquedivisa GSE-PSE-MK23-08B]
MKKIMFYCQYLAGMGHLVRSTEIIRSLVKEFQVCFVNGGQPISEFEFPVGVTVIHLAPILEEEGKLAAVDPTQNIEAVKEIRQDQLLQIFDQFRPDCLMIECFPFSKHKLKFELLPLLDRAKNTQTKVVCSLRDLIMTQTLLPAAWAKRYDKVCNWVNQYFDLVLIHGDPKLQRLEEQFPHVDRLNCELYYTGYVAQSSPRSLLSNEDVASLNQLTPLIVASAGGGRFGYKLLQAVAAASAILGTTLPHRFQIFTGPFMPEEEVDKLQSFSNGKLIVRRYTPHLLKYLERSDLSISLGGYNTTMNILRTGVRSLVFPGASEEQTGEQTIRAKKLAARGVLRILEPEDLQPDRLTEKILSYLKQAPVSHTFDLNGAEKAALRLKELLYGMAITA